MQIKLEPGYLFFQCSLYHQEPEGVGRTTCLLRDGVIKVQKILKTIHTQNQKAALKDVKIGFTEHTESKGDKGEKATFGSYLCH